jgi:hypothetical protein
MGQINVTGALVAGPPASGEVFPGASSNIPLSLASNPKIAGVMTGCLTRLIASPGGFVTLSGVGATDTVTHGDTLYLKCDAELSVRLTQDDGLGGNVVSTLFLSGANLLEFSPTKFLKLLEVKGTATIEYFVSGLI